MNFFTLRGGGEPGMDDPHPRYPPLCLTPTSPTDLDDTSKNYDHQQRLKRRMNPMFSKREKRIQNYTLHKA